MEAVGKKSSSYYPLPFIDPPPSIFPRRVFEFLGRKSKDKRLAPQAEQYFLGADLWEGWCSHSSQGFSGSYWEEKTVNLNGLTLYWSQIPYCCQPIPFSFLLPATSSSCGVTPPSPFFPFLFSTQPPLVTESFCEPVTSYSNLTEERQKSESSKCPFCVPDNSFFCQFCESLQTWYQWPNILDIPCWWNPWS